MNSKHTFHPELSMLLATGAWENPTGKDSIGDYLYDHLESLIRELSEQGLPDNLTDEMVMYALLLACAVSSGRLETCKLVAALTVTLINDVELHT